MASHQKKGLKTRATFVFADESGFSERPPVRRTWAPKGKTPIIKSTGSWKARSVIGAIAGTPQRGKPRLFLRITKGTVRSPHVQRYLQHLRRHIRGKVMLVWDGLAAHRSKIVKVYTEQQKSWLTIHRFPAYAPELNPQEYVWSAMKGKDTANFCPDDIAGLDSRIRQSGQRLRRRSCILTGCFVKSGLFTEKEC